MTPSPSSERWGLIPGARRARSSVRRVRLEWLPLRTAEERAHTLDPGDVVDVARRPRDPCSSVGGGLVAGALTDLLEEGLDLGRSLLRGCEDEGGPLAGVRGGLVGGEAHRSILQP